MRIREALGRRPSGAHHAWTSMPMEDRILHTYDYACTVHTYIHSAPSPATATPSNALLFFFSCRLLGAGGAGCVPRVRAAGPRPSPAPHCVCSHALEGPPGAPPSPGSGTLGTEGRAAARGDGVVVVRLRQSWSTFKVCRGRSAPAVGDWQVPSPPVSRWRRSGGVPSTLPHLPPPTAPPPPPAWSARPPPW